jgi:hypothetical protein
MLRKILYRERNFSPCHSENAAAQSTVSLKNRKTSELPSEQGLFAGGFGIEDSGGENNGRSESVGGRNRC